MQPRLLNVVIDMLKEIEELIDQKVAERTSQLLLKVDHLNGMVNQLNARVNQLIEQLEIFNDTMNGVFEDVTEQPLPEVSPAPWEI